MPFSAATGVAEAALGGLKPQPVTKRRHQYVSSRQRSKDDAKWTWLIFQFAAEAGKDMKIFPPFQRRLKARMAALSLMRIFNCAPVPTLQGYLFPIEKALLWPRRAAKLDSCRAELRCRSLAPKIG